MRVPIRNYRVAMKTRVLPCNPNYYELNKRNRFTRWIMKVLLKLKVVRHKSEYEEYTTHNYVEIDINDLYNSLKKEVFYFQSKGIPLDRILVGRDIYDKFLRGEICKSISIPYTPETSFLGVRVQLNPYIDGVVFVPRDNSF